MTNKTCQHNEDGFRDRAKDTCSKHTHDWRTRMEEPDIGDFAACKDGHSGIVTAVKDSFYGRMIFIIESDGRVYHFPLDMLAEPELEDMV